MKSIQNLGLEELCLIALDQHVFPDDDEFETIFGFDRQFIVDLMHAIDKGCVEDATYVSIQNSIRLNILGYPHGAGEYLKRRYGLEW